MSDRLAAALAEVAAVIRDEIKAEVTPATPDRLLSIDQAAAMLGIGRSRLYDEIGAGHLRSIVIGRRRLVPASSIDQYINAKVSGAAE